jgi:hypothetical protein
MTTTAPGSQLAAGAQAFQMLTQEMLTQQLAMEKAELRQKVTPWAPTANGWLLRRRLLIPVNT